MSQSLPDVVLRRAGRGPGRAPVQPEQSPRRTVRQNARALAGVPLFAGFSERHLRTLAANSDVQTFDPGVSIVDEGAPGETLFVVLAGTAKVVRRGRRVGEVLPGDFFGELAALDGGPRTASVIAETPVAVLRLFRRTLVATLRTEPQLTAKLLEGLARRLREVERIRPETR